MLPEVVGIGEPSDRRRQAPTSAYETGGGPTTGTPHNPAAPHDPPISCHQTTGRQHEHYRSSGFSSAGTLKQSPAAALVQQALAEYS